MDNDIRTTPKTSVTFKLVKVANYLNVYMFKMLIICLNISPFRYFVAELNSFVAEPTTAAFTVAFLFHASRQP